MITKFSVYLDGIQTEKIINLVVPEPLISQLSISYWLEGDTYQGNLIDGDNRISWSDDRSLYFRVTGNIENPRLMGYCVERKYNAFNKVFDNLYDTIALSGDSIDELFYLEPELDEVTINIIRIT